MTTHNNTHDTDSLEHRERPIGFLAAAVSRRTRHAVRSALADAGVSHRDLRLLTIIDREPQTAQELAERRARRREERQLRCEHSHAGRGHHGKRHRHHGPSHRHHDHDHSGAHGHSGEHEHGLGSRPTLGQRLAHLEERGLIATDASGILTLTDAGTAQRNTARDTLAAVKERYSAGVPEADLETTRRTLHAIAHNLAG